MFKYLVRIRYKVFNAHKSEIISTILNSSLSLSLSLCEYISLS